MKVKAKCAYCKRLFPIENGAYNRAKKAGLRVSCSRKHAGLGRRTSKAEKVERVRLYGIVYRKKNMPRILKRMKKYNESPAGKAMQKRNRDKFKDYHNAYCMTPKYQAYKKKYDVINLAKRAGGEYWESVIMIKQIKAEFRKQVPDKYERMKLKGAIQRMIDKRQAKRRMLIEARV